MAESAHADEHGHSVAAWTGVVVIILGGAIASIGVALLSTWLFVVGLVVALIGAIAGKVLSMAGFGAASKRSAQSPRGTGH